MDRHTWQRIHDLSAEGLNIRAIARRLRIHRRTVRKALDAERLPTRADSPRGSIIDSYRGWLLARLEQGKRIFLQDLFREAKDRIDLIEIQEAFAAQVLADLKEMGVGEADHGKINVNGSGISLGHPIACTGTRVLVTLLHEMQRRKARYGLECICGGGGLGIAAVFERN